MAQPAVGGAPHSLNACGAATYPRDPREEIHTAGWAAAAHHHILRSEWTASQALCQEPQEQPQWHSREDASCKRGMFVGCLSCVLYLLRIQKGGVPLSAGVPLTPCRFLNVSAPLACLQPSFVLAGAFPSKSHWVWGGWAHVVRYQDIKADAKLRYSWSVTLCGRPTISCAQATRSHLRARNHSRRHVSSSMECQRSVTGQPSSAS